VTALYRVARTDAGGAFLPFVSLSGETNGKETGAVNAAGTYDPNLVNGSSGGTVLFAGLGLYSMLSPTTIFNLGFAKAFYRYMNFDPAFDPDPAENYKIDLSLTYLF
jgi:hypothetical protein